MPIESSNFRHSLTCVAIASSELYRSGPRASRLCSLANSRWTDVRLSRVLTGI